MADFKARWLRRSEPHEDRRRHLLNVMATYERAADQMALGSPGVPAQRANAPAGHRARIAMR
jgi:hypothetical protein